MSIRQDDRAYRRGVVFGFTVAEVVLLLVFCLLLLFMPFLLREQQRVAEAAQAAAAAAKARAIATAAPPKEPPVGEKPKSGQTVKPKPLPDGWIRVVPNTQESSDQTSPKDDRARPSDYSTLEPAAPAPAQKPVEALTLKSACERLGVPAQNCAVAQVDEALKSSGQHNWPPIIKLKEADGYYFAVGSAELLPAFAAKLRDIGPLIKNLADQYRTDIVEVVGHTDEQPIRGMSTNLDDKLFDVIVGGAEAGQLRAADNAGLGFARAVAVVQVLRGQRALEEQTILPLSAAQVVDTSGKLATGSNAGDVKERRRIEIRLRQSEQARDKAGK